MNRLIDLARVGVRIPLVGPRLVAGAVGLVAPYFASISPEVTLLGPGRCDVRLRNRRSVRNHIGTVHAIAMCNMCELAAGLAIEATIDPALRWIPRGMTVRYLQKAETDLVASATLAPPSSTLAGDVVVPVKVRGLGGDIVMEAEITMYVSPRKARPSITRKAVPHRIACRPALVRAPGNRLSSPVDMPTPLDDARYINLLSFKRDGGGVETPVWAAPLDDKLVVFTNRDSYKVKRIGRNPKVRVARCDARGKLLGPWLDGTCTIASDPAQQERILDALKAKYGLQMRVLNFFAGLVGRDKQRAYLEIALG